MNGIFGSWTRASRLTLIVALTGTGICLPTIAQSSPGIPPGTPIETPAEPAAENPADRLLDEIPEAVLLPPNGAKAPVVTMPDTRDPSQLLSANTIDAMYRLSLREIRSEIANPTVEDYRRLALALSILQRETPDDIERLRFLLDAWTWAGDERRERTILGRIVRMDPTDTVLQLRLINSAIQSKQNADTRLAMYERFLGPAGEKIDDSVKSRLALDAALLYREMGDEADRKSVV